MSVELILKTERHCRGDGFPAPPGALPPDYSAATRLGAGLRRRRESAGSGPVCPRSPVTLAAHLDGPGRFVFRQSLADQIGYRRHFEDARRRMAGAPDVAPARWLVVPRPDVDVFADFYPAALGQRIGIEPGGDDQRPQHIGLQPVNARVRRTSSALLATSM